MMTYEEQEQLIGDGWSPRVIVELRDRGFREVSPVINGDGSKTPSFLRQTEFPHIHIALEKSTTLEALDTAIYDAGQKDRHQWIADKWHMFGDIMKRWYRPQKADDLEARLARIEAKLANHRQQQQTTANSHEPPH